MVKALHFNSCVFRLWLIIKKNLLHAKNNVFTCEYGYSVCLRLWCRGIRLQDAITQSVIVCILEIPVVSARKQVFPGVFLYLLQSCHENIGTRLKIEHAYFYIDPVLLTEHKESFRVARCYKN
jgi:hypothetical protein